MYNTNGLFAARNSRSGYEIDQSLRFNDAYLSRTPSSAGNRRTFTLSVWLKRSGISAISGFFGAWNSVSNRDAFRFDSANSLRIFLDETTDANISSNALYRDVSAWYHFVAAIDTTQATAADRVKIWINGESVSFSSASYPPQNTDLHVNNTVGQYVGTAYSQTEQEWQGYLAEFHLVDGTALDPTDFGEFDNNGVWRPKRYTGSYGTNGFYLKFDPSATNGIGHDHSGNGNNFSPTGFTTSGTGTDVMSDTPTTNWCTLNPVFKNINTGNTYTQGNLVATNGTGGYSFIFNSTIPVSSGKWYAECTMSGYSGTPSPTIGVQDAGNKKDVGNELVGTETGDVGYDLRAGKIYKDGNYDYATGYTTATSGDTIGIKLDLDGNTIEFLKNNTSVGSAVAIATGTGLKVFAGGQGDGTSGIGCVFTWNFGQRAFAYTPPTGYKTLSTDNLPEPTIKDGSQYFNTVLYTGNGIGSSQAVTGVGFQPDLVWIKARSFAGAHKLVDAVRGADKFLESSSTGAESTTAFNSFDSDGFTITGSSGFNNGTETFVAWAWDAGGNGSSNTDGTITSTVSANPSAGFSIVSYAGNNSASATVGHGLGVSPGLVIVKDRSTSDYVWMVKFAALGGNILQLDGTGAANAPSTYSVGTIGTLNSTTFGFTTNNTLQAVNGTGQNYIAYCFAEVESYSKFGKYAGNSSTDGTFVYTGFRPAFVMCKNTQGGSWFMHDTTRMPYNPAPNELLANSSLAEGSSYPLDILSNGFKWRSASGEVNTGPLYIFAAFAEHPFGGSGVSPATAR